VDYGPGNQRFDGFPPQGMHHGGGHWVTWLVPLVFLLLMAATWVWVVAQARGGRFSARPVQATDAALEELRLRYARGEVNREDFLAAEADLRGLPPATT
jgi:putative membrane protein